MEITDSGKVSEGDDIGETRIKERLSTALKKPVIVSIMQSLNWPPRPKIRPILSFIKKPP